MFSRVLLCFAAIGCSAPAQPPSLDSGGDSSFVADTAAIEVGDSDALGSDTTDAQPETSECCPIAPTPSCDCIEVGGSRIAGKCRPAWCDVPAVSWSRRTDDAGCPMWVQIDDKSCLPTKPVDAGPG